jgi:hypothetical protein
MHDKTHTCHLHFPYNVFSKWKYRFVRDGEGTSRSRDKDVLSILRPVGLTFFLGKSIHNINFSYRKCGITYPAFKDSCQHDNSWDTVFPHHAPKVLNRVISRT